MQRVQSMRRNPYPQVSVLPGFGAEPRVSQTWPCQLRNGTDHGGKPLTSGSADLW